MDQKWKRKYPMTWTTTPPKEAGWYWVKWKSRDEIVKISGPIAHMMGIDKPIEIAKLKAISWQGPIRPEE